MAEVMFSPKLGLVTGPPDHLTPQGGLRRAVGVWYKPADAEQLHALRGRIPLGSLPATSAILGIDFLQYESSDEMLIAAANGKLYESAASRSSLTWATAKDAQGSPADFTFTGTRLVTIHSGTNEWLVTGGATGERPLIRDVDGHWRRLGMRQPGDLTIAPILSGPTTIRPTSALEDVAGEDWDSPEKGYDSDDTTYASARVGEGQYAQITYSFSAGGTTLDNFLFATVGISSLPISDDGAPRGDGRESIVFVLEVEASTDAGASWVKIGTMPWGGGTQTFQASVSNGVTINNIKVRVTLTCSSGTADATGYVYDVRLVDGGGPTLVAAGDYNYLATVVYKRTLSNGVTIEVESAPTNVVKFTADGTTMYGAMLTFGQPYNGPTEGLPTANLFWRVYRSLGDGVYPNLGRIGEAPISSAVYSDGVTEYVTELGIPFPVVSVNNFAVPLNNTPPALRDVWLYRGALMGIPVDLPTHLQYALPAQPDSWPLPAHDISSLPTDRNDELEGGTTLNDMVFVWTKTQMIRVRDIPFITETSFDLNRLEMELFAADVGLAARQAYVMAPVSDLGDQGVWWVAASGIYFTNGYKTAERGLGIRKATLRLDWERTVDLDQLSSATLDYDPTMNVLWFTYVNPLGAREALTLHVDKTHWVPVDSITSVPKITGPHAEGFSRFRAGGELNGRLRQWSLGDAGDVWAEEGPVGDAKIIVEYPWAQLGGVSGGLLVNEAYVYHSDWGPHDAADLEVLTRREQSGHVQVASKKGFPLRGGRFSKLWINRSGDAVKIKLRHQGPASGAFGPVVLDPEGTHTEGR